MSQDAASKRRLRDGKATDNTKQEQEARGQESQVQEMKTRTRLVANLHSAANEGKVELVRLLLRCGADANAQDEQFNNTALHQAAWNGFSQTVQVLCKHGAYTSVRNKAKFTPLHMASQQGHNQTARLLLMAGAKTEAKNSYGDTPLHTAARYGHAGVARILLSARSNPNQVNKNHDTPLHIAAAMNRRKLTKIFMQNGAEPAIKNKELIANPPALPSAGRHADCHAQHEQRYGQLYARHPQPHPARHTRRSRHQRSRQRHAHPSSDDSGSVLEQRLARLALHSGRARTASRAGRRRATELAVDVPVEAHGPLSKSAAFSSLHSIGGMNPRRAHPRTRTTIGASSSGADLHLLPGLLSSRPLQQRPSSRLLAPRAGLHPDPQRTASSVDLDRTEESACPPDARDNPAEWATIMAKSARFQAQGPQTVIEADESEKSPDAAGPEPAASPSASLRSSLSKSRGRLLVRRRKQKASLLVRRPNLGTCVGKLSLVRLRAIVNRRQATRTEAEESGEREIPEGRRSTSEPPPAKSPEKPVAAGRRQERLDRLRESTGIGELRAPNGIQLLATRPLAALGDETQLYAIPQKSKSIAKQQVADKEAADKGRKLGATASTASDCGSPSGGPALTSDGGHSSAGSSDSHIASSPDQCVVSLDIVCPNKRSQRLNAALPAAPPALVGVHGSDRELYPTPGYSTVRELPAIAPERADNEGSEPCLCHAGYQQQASDKSCQLAAPSTSSTPQPHLQRAEPKGRQQAEQQVAASKTSRLRQLLHLESRPKQDRCKATAADEPHKTADGSRPDQRSLPASGYYAYSPVVQSTSELRPAERKQPGAGHESDKSTGSRSSAKKSWLMSRFSLSSGAVPQSENSPAADAGSHAADRETQQDNSAPLADPDANETTSSTSSALLGPERKAELIRISSSDLSSRRLFHAPEVSSGLETDEQPSRLIRPKSALSATSADLIAAQKSLATAAAAKVHRDRLVKLIEQNQDAPSQELDQNETANKEGVLTVKTSDPFWTHLHHAQPVDGGLVPKYMIGQPMIANGHHRSGSNSVGMSDSSPSNNGAESDNSIQTTSGSANTDTASQQNSGGQNPSPLGILSRILLNNKSLGYSSKQSNNGTQQQQPTDELSIKSSAESSTLRDESVANGSLSSSAQSSPLSSNRSPGAIDKPIAKLDQLASRSRRPIVMTCSNGSSESGEKKADQSEPQPNPQQPPPLPAKGVLKSIGPKSISKINIGPPVMAESAANGLPQVSSFSQISSFANKPTAETQQQPLCNYHALGQPRANHLTHAQYGPYSPYPTQTRYTFHEAGPEPLVGAKYTHHLNHHQLGASPRSIDLTLPASALNYEYYLDSPLTAYHQHLNQTNAFHYGDATTAANNDNPLYSSYPQDYSIYVPDNREASHSAQTHDNSSQATGQFSS